MMGMVLSASTTVLADSTIRLTTSPTTPSLHNLQAGEAVSAASLPVRAVSVHCEAMLSSRGLG